MATNMVLPLFLTIAAWMAYLRSLLSGMRWRKEGDAWYWQMGMYV